MPYPREKHNKYQNARRLAARPCMICGELGEATEKYRSTPAAPEIRACAPCIAKITTPIPPQDTAQRMMDALAMRWLPPTARIVAATIEFDETYPKAVRVAELTGICPANVRHAQAVLRKHGFLSRRELLGKSHPTQQN